MHEITTEQSNCLALRSAIVRKESNRRGEKFCNKLYEYVFCQNQQENLALGPIFFAAKLLANFLKTFWRSFVISIFWGFQTESV